MKRISIWLMATLSSSVLLLGYHTSTAGPSASAGPAGATAGTKVYSGTLAGSSPSADPATSTPGSSSTGTSGTSTSGTGTSGGSTSTKKKTVTGDVAQTQWGPVQVQLTVTATKITEVAVIQYPQGNPRDDDINSYALPVLIKETEQQQSAQIDMVSGATVTSDGYLQSLQSALDRAGL